MSRQAKSQEQGNLVPGHFLIKIRTFFKNQRCKEINLKLCSDFVKNRYLWMPVLLHFYLKHHNIYSYNPSFSKFVRINCPDISEFQSQFPDKNNLFACLFWFLITYHSQYGTPCIINKEHLALLLTILKSVRRVSVEI